jgi:hypothetical protein
VDGELTLFRAPVLESPAWLLRPSQLAGICSLAFAPIQERTWKARAPKPIEATQTNSRFGSRMIPDYRRELAPRECVATVPRRGYRGAEDGRGGETS